MNAQVRLARPQDRPELVELMVEFYREGGYELSREAAARAFSTLLADPSRGRIWLIEDGNEPRGYIVLTFAFSMEYGGLRGFVDDFFVRPAARGRGLGAAALQEVKRNLASLGVRALLVETGPDGHPARGVYARAGFAESGRVLLSQPLSPPLHET